MTHTSGVVFGDGDVAAILELPSLTSLDLSGASVGALSGEETLAALRCACRVQKWCDF